MINVAPASDQPMAPLERTTRAVTVYDGEKMLGYAGVYLDDGRLFMYSEIPAEHRQKHRKAILRAWRILIGMVKDKGLPIHATAQADIPTAPHFLTHLGFRRLAGNLYEWDRNGR